MMVICLFILYSTMHNRMYNFKTVCIYNFLNAGYLDKPKKKTGQVKKAHILIGERGRNIQWRMGTQVALAEQWY